MSRRLFYTECRKRGVTEMEMTPELVRLLAQLLDVCVQMAQQEQQAARTRQQVQQLAVQIREILDRL